MNTELLSTQLATWRASAGLSREQASVRLGVSMATYVRWETNKSKPQSLAALATVKRELASAISKAE